ncbi:MAG: hypothetical protein M3461_19360 [Pseudomonadota bacterium]|nr:hypothetical protein [Pseudomonadota bacterium]
MESDEAEQVASFRELSPGQRAMLLSARKEPGKYTEGAVLFQALVRMVPPPPSLALAMTEPEVVRNGVYSHHRAGAGIPRRALRALESCRPYSFVLELEALS